MIFTAKSKPKLELSLSFIDDFAMHKSIGVFVKFNDFKAIDFFVYYFKNNDSTLIAVKKCPRKVRAWT